MRRNKRTTAVLVAVVTGCALGVAVAVARDLRGSEELSRERFLQLSRQRDPALVLPRELPGSYEWVDEIEFSAPPQVEQSTAYRTLMYYDRVGERSARTCITRNAAACAPRPGDLVLSEGPFDIVVHFVPGTVDADRTHWRAADFTRDLAEVAWLN